MGCSIGVSGSSFDKSVSMFERWKSQSDFDDSNDQNVDSLPNPDPANYSIIRSDVVNGYLIIEVKYHDCTNYEGRKIMIFNCSLDELMKQKLIDPHFCDNKNYFSPIARFEPTEQGWDDAINFAKIKKKLK